MATHDLRSTAHFEQIIVLDKGAVVGQGTHDELKNLSALPRAMDNGTKTNGDIKPYSMAYCEKMNG